MKPETIHWHILPANEATAWHLIGNAVGPVQAADVIRALRAAA